MRGIEEPSRRLGVIAGAGRFPYMVTSGAQDAGFHVTVVGLRGLAEAGLSCVADQFYWAGMARMGRWIRLLRREGIHHVILAGSVRKCTMYGRLRLLRLMPDLTSLKIWFLRIPDKRNDTVLGALADEFSRFGIVMEECTRFCDRDMAPDGVITRAQPTNAQRRDADFGWPIAKAMGELDIGQSIAVKETEVVAVEAIEGTDRMIERAGALCRRSGWTLIKVAKPKQDKRFDVPTVGPDTIKRMASHGGRMLVIEAGETLIVDREDFLRTADVHSIVVWGRA